MSTEIEQQIWSIYGTTEGPKVFELQEGKKTIIGCWGGPLESAEYYPDVMVEAKSRDSADILLMFRPGRIRNPTVIRSNGLVEKIQKDIPSDPHIDPEGKVTLNKGDTLVYSAEGYKAAVRQK